MEIHFDNVSKGYGRGLQTQAIFERLTTRFESGKISGILGRSGMGKSTLLNLMAGIDAPDRGQVRVGDQLLSSFTEEESCAFRRTHIGFVFQFFHLIPELTVGENVMLVPELSGASVAMAREAARQTLADVGLPGKIDAFPDTLSGGERQRVAIARALAQDPGLILADEPTGNLDRETGKKVMELFLSLVRDKGKTVVMVTHSREMAGLCDDLYEVRDKGLYKP